MDKTYIKIKGQWNYMYRAVNKEGQMVAADRQDLPVAEQFDLLAT